jgi:hypothetical protein
MKGMMTKCVQRTLLLIAIIAVSPAHAISAAHRAALERSGCDMQTEATWCDIHKTKTQNEANRPADDQSNSTTEAERTNMASFLQSHVVAQPKASAFAALVEQGFMRENDGDYFKITDRSVLHVLMTFKTDGTVATAILK